jgi:TRAP-type C4-dicarboxylate transport system substrate-binding protein
MSDRIRSIAAALAGLVALVSGVMAHADESGAIVLRFASVAPNGSPWAREFQAFTRGVEQGTAGRVHIKWYFNGVAGDEIEELDRMRHGQLDGAASGQMACERLAPTLNIGRLPGVFQSRDEAAVVINRLVPTISTELHHSGFELLSIAGLGPSVFLTRRPVKTLEELRQTRLWRWDADDVGTAAMRAMGMSVEPLPLADAAHAYEQNRVDGFVGIPAAALAFQWSALARYVVDLRADYLFGCLIMTESSFARLRPADQTALRAEAARVQQLFEELGRRNDDALLGGLFEKQGLIKLPVSPQFRAQFFSSALEARTRVGQKFVSSELMSRVMGLLADYRAERAGASR